MNYELETSKLCCVLDDFYTYLDYVERGKDHNKDEQHLAHKLRADLRRLIEKHQVKSINLK